MNLLALGVWLAVIASTVVLFRGLRRAMPHAGPAPQLLGLSEAAFVTGGPGGVVDTALVSLLGDGRLVVGGPGIVQVRPGAQGSDPAERAVLQAHAQAPSGWLYQVRYLAMLDPAIQETGDALVARGLLARPGWGHRWRRRAVAQIIVCAVLLVLSLPLTFVALALQPDPGVPFIVEVFPVLIGGIVLGAAAAKRARQWVSPAGQRALAEMRTRYAGLSTPPVQTALFGLRGLRDPYLRSLLVPAARGTRLAAAQHGSRPPRTSGSVGSSSHSGGSHTSCGSGAEVVPVVWCASSDPGGSGSGCGYSVSGCASSGSGCGSSGSSCGGSSSSCSSSSSSSSCSSGSSCSSSSSSCSSSS
ncbi:TIGR04222 domain-containing membrane protein [Streptomyces sp. NPDC032472]|uniref:TIGR04222 domain-containing membrane protein n=1 Tax=Streptomyces sp. NPDC032472 TaxID=3155018 RepID=UPI0033E7FF86